MDKFPKMFTTAMPSTFSLVNNDRSQSVTIYKDTSLGEFCPDLKRWVEQFPRYVITGLKPRLMIAINTTLNCNAFSVETEASWNAIMQMRKLSPTDHDQITEYQKVNMWPSILKWNSGDPTTKVTAIWCTFQLTLDLPLQDLPYAAFHHHKRSI